MTTTKTISTISFNTKQFVEEKLKSLYEMKVIRFYCYIQHKAEEDTKKDHFHIFLEPNGKIDLTQLQEQFEEIEEIGKEPLKCLPFNITKDFGDWYLYSKHDKDYLIEKSLNKRYYYKEEDFNASDTDYLDYKKSQINFNITNKKLLIKKAIEKGLSFNQILTQSNIIPINQINAYKSLYQAIEEDLRDLTEEEYKEKIY